MGTDLLKMPKIYSIQEYLDLEEISKDKHEFFNGNIINMPGATYYHNLIATNVIIALGNKLLNTNYKVLNSDMKIRVPKLNSIVYPDAVIICEVPEFYNNRNDIILNPLLIVEVLSPTEDYDRKEKFAYYKTLPSFKEYVLILQKQPWVVSSFNAEDKVWKDTEAENINDSILLHSINCTIELNRIYNGISFES